MGTLLRPLPTSLQHSRTLASLSTASALVSEFLLAAESLPYLHPRSTFSAEGVSTGVSGLTRGLILHDLKRVEAGLKGEVLAPEEEDEFPEVVDEAAAGAAAGAGGVGGLLAHATREEEVGVGPDMGQDGWQDKEEFDREQSIEYGEVGERERAGVDAMKGAGIGMEGGKVPQVQTTKSAGDKEERRMRKKDKRSAEKREREARLRKEKEMEGL